VQDVCASRAQEETETYKEEEDLKNSPYLETSAVARESEAQDDGGEPVDNEWPVQIPADLWRMP
jgi:hypothetical protein